jgi:hypothetical protein
MVPKAGRIEKTVFISYRRASAPWAELIFQDLTRHGYDAFFDFSGLASGGFEEVLFESIRARAHFIVLLTPSALERCADPADLFRREIETALENQRNIVALMLEGFDFNAVGVDAQLGDSLAVLKRYNGLPVYSEYVPEGMTRLRDRFLCAPLNTVLHPASPSAERAARADQAAAAQAPGVTLEQLKAAAEPRFLFRVKLWSADEIELVQGTHAEESNGPSSLVVYDASAVVARYPSGVERWSRQPLRA